jgi:hypothetical protein
MFVPSNILNGRLQHACGGEGEKQELVNAINAGGGGVALTGARLHLTSPQSINADTTTPLSGFTVEYDDFGAYDPGSPTRITIPATGWYFVFQHVNWDVAVTGNVVNDFRKNGNSFIGSVSQIIANNSADNNGCTLGFFLKNEYLEFTAFNHTGGALNAHAAEVGIMKFF